MAPSTSLEELVRQLADTVNGLRDTVQTQTAELELLRAGQQQIAAATQQAGAIAQTAEQHASDAQTTANMAGRLAEAAEQTAQQAGVAARGAGDRALAAGEQALTAARVASAAMTIRHTGDIDKLVKGVQPFTGDKEGMGVCFWIEDLQHAWEQHEQLTGSALPAYAKYVSITLKCSGAAKSAIDSYRQDGGNVHDTDALLAHLENTFLPPDIRLARGLEVCTAHMRPEETLQKYYERFNQLLKQMDKSLALQNTRMPDQVVRSLFLQGIKHPQLKNEALRASSHFPKLSALVSHVSGTAAGVAHRQELEGSSMQLNEIKAEAEPSSSPQAAPKNADLAADLVALLNRVWPEGGKPLGGGAGPGGGGRGPGPHRGRAQQKGQGSRPNSRTPSPPRPGVQLILRSDPTKHPMWPHNLVRPAHDLNQLVAEGKCFICRGPNHQAAGPMAWRTAWMNCPRYKELTERFGTNAAPIAARPNKGHGNAG